MMPMDSASERYENARHVLNGHGRADAKPSDPGSVAQLTLALRSLLKDPTEGYDVEAIAEEVLLAESGTDIRSIVQKAVQRGIYAAWETWEPADRPDQETMLRWLGIVYERPTEGLLYIPEQSIEEEP